MKKSKPVLPSERIREIAEQKAEFLRRAYADADSEPSYGTYITSIMDYLDEQSRKEGE